MKSHQGLRKLIFGGFKLFKVTDLVQLLLILPSDLDKALHDGSLNTKAGLGSVHPESLQPSVHLFAGQVARRLPPAVLTG